MPDQVDTAGDYSISSTLLGMFLGADFRAAMKSIISLGVGDALRMHVGDTPFGPTAIWDTQNAGRNMYEHFMQQTTSSLLQSTAQTRETARYEFNQRFAGMLGIDPAGMNPLGMTMTSFFGNELFRRMGTQQLEMGLGLANRYMGAMPMGFVGDQNRDEQRRLQDQLTTFNQTVMQDFVRNFDQYGGLSGAGVGRILAEGARLGMVDPGDPMSAVNFAQRTARMVGTAQQFFQGSATEVMDQLNATLGMNAVATLGGPQGYGPGYGTGTQLNTLLTNMSAAGMVTGLTDQQMRMLTTGAANMAAARGGSPLGALANARDTALFATAANRSGVTAFVNEATLRQSIMNQVVRTQESEASRAVYGAYAMIEAQAPGAGDQFLERVQERGVNLDLSGVVDLVNEEMRSRGMDAVGASDLINAGYSQRAEQARAGGRATVAMMQSRLGSIQDDRATFLQQMGIDVAQFGGNLSVQNIERTIDDPTMAGRIRQIFGRQAQRYGYRSAEDMDAALRSTRLAAQMQEAMSDVSSFQMDMQGFGRVRGAMGFIGLVNRLGAGGGDVDMNMARLAESLIGGDSEGLRNRILQRNNLFRKENIRAITESGDTDQLLGLDVAAQALMSGQIGGQRLTADEMEELRETFLTEDVKLRTERLQRYAGMADPGRRLALASERATTEIMQRHGVLLREGEQGPQLSQQELAKRRREYADEGKLVAQLREYDRLARESAETGVDTLLSGGRAGKEFGAYADRYASLVEQTGDVKAARATLREELGEKTFKEFMSNFEANTNVQTSMGASAETSAMGKIIFLIQELINKVTRDGIKTNPEPSEQAPKKEGGSDGG